MTMKPTYPRLENEDFFHLPLGSGGDGSVCTVRREDDLVGKYFPRKNNWMAEHEYGIASTLYSAGVSVPKPEGVYTLFLWGGLLQKPAFVMERIREPKLSQILSKWIDYSRRQELNQKLNRELDKARDLGFLLNDTTAYNAFYSEEEDRIILFDFARWERV